MESNRLKSHEIFRLLRPQQLNAISTAAREVTYKAGESVFRKGDTVKSFYVVVEGQVELGFLGPDGMDILIDKVPEGSVFGACVCFQLDTYSLNATCTQDSRILEIEATALKRMMDEDLLLGNAIQSLISKVYFKRYIDTMHQLQTVIQRSFSAGAS